jgi:hypothetical protein
MGKSMKDMKAMKAMKAMKVSPQHEKFLCVQSRKFRLDGAWRNRERGCGCRRKSGTD